MKAWPPLFTFSARRNVKCDVLIGSNVQVIGSHDHSIAPSGNAVVRAQELCESRGGRPGLRVFNSPCGLRGRKATLNRRRAQELCESSGERPSPSEHLFNNYF